MVFILFAFHFYFVVLFSVLFSEQLYRIGRAESRTMRNPKLTYLTLSGFFHQNHFLTRKSNGRKLKCELFRDSELVTVFIINFTEFNRYSWQQLTQNQKDRTSFSIFFIKRTSKHHLV